MGDPIVNIFKDGPVVEGDSFLGYRTQRRELKHIFLDDRGSRSIRGMHRMGKTSLMRAVELDAAAEEYKYILTAYVDLGEIHEDEHGKYTYTAYDNLLWQIVRQLERNLRKKNILEDSKTEDLRELITEFKETSPRTMDYRGCLKDIFQELHTLGWHMLLTLDEFDAAENIFEDRAQFELFRTLVNSQYGIGIAFVSRRPLYKIEKSSPNNSAFATAVSTFAVHGFERQDRSDFYRILRKRYQVELPDDERARLEYYAGVSPYIYSMFGREIVESLRLEQDLPTMDAIYVKRADDIQNYYDRTVLNRLEADGELAKLAGFVVGPKLDVNRGDKDRLISLGYLRMNEQEQYEAFSGYFSDFLRVCAIGRDTWKNLISVERQAKILLRQEMSPNNNDVECWQILLSDAYRKFYGYHFDLAKSGYLRSIENNKRYWGVESDLLDVMSLKDVFLLIKLKWNSNFAKFFGNEEYRRWQEAFRRCADARNPIAHGHDDYLDDDDKALVNTYALKIYKHMTE